MQKKYLVMTKCTGDTNWTLEEQHNSKKEAVKAAKRGRRQECLLGTKIEVWRDITTTQKVLSV